MMLGLPKIQKNKIFLLRSKSRQGQKNFAFEEFVSDPKNQFLYWISTRGLPQKIHDDSVLLRVMMYLFF
jgi:hypothetical protein